MEGESTWESWRPKVEVGDDGVHTMSSEDSFFSRGHRVGFLRAWPHLLQCSRQSGRGQRAGEAACERHTHGQKGQSGCCPGSLETRLGSWPEGRVGGQGGLSPSPQGSCQPFLLPACLRWEFHRAGRTANEVQVLGALDSEGRGQATESPSPTPAPAE